MSNLFCNAPFCQNTRNPNHAWCSTHRWEREKYKIKVYKEVLPYWCLKKCSVHGFLKSNEVYVYPNKKHKVCLQCREANRPIYDPIKGKEYNDRHSDRRKDRRLKKRYKISIDAFQALLSHQNNSCALCNISIEDHQKRKGSNHWFAVDHCHITGKIRGLLCIK